MKAGVIGTVDGEFEVVDSRTETVEDDGYELTRCLEIDRVFSLPSGEMAFQGRAAAEILSTDAQYEIVNQEIETRDDPRIETVHTSFVGIPGEFVVVDSGSGTFAFDLIAADTNTEINRATLDLDEFYGTRNGVRPWKAGFHGNGDSDVNGIFHGEDLRDSHDIESILADSSLNQLGLAYEYDGVSVKMTASRSAYVELYQPAAFDTEEYLEYIRQQILSHLD